MSSVTSNELDNKIKQNGHFYLIDVRTSSEFNSECIDSKCRNLPLDQIMTLGLPKESEIVLICASGKRSSRARETLTEQGYSNVYSLEGGLANWKACKLPTRRAQGVLPIMQQVQVAAGVLILVSALGSLLITSGLIWLTIAVGIGLTFAGLSGWCGMARLLYQMPWNKKQEPVG